MGDVGFCRQVDFVLMFYVHDDKDGRGIVLAEELVDEDILRLKLATSGIPPHKSLLSVDLRLNIAVPS